MTRYAAGVEYDGRSYHGWQKQRHALAVQEVVERALSIVANDKISSVCAGRTDSGVHALGQVIHFDSAAQRSERSWVLGANSNLPTDVGIRWVREVSADFHARFGALNRRYRYLIHVSHARSALWAGRVTESMRPLDVARMAAAAADLQGRHDFSAFRATACQAHSPVRDLQSLRVSGHGPWVVIDAQANAFLHHMVRNIAGVLMSIGRGDAPVTWAREVLQGRSREQGGITAPASGLYFMRAEYEPVFNLPPPADSGLPL